MSKVKEMALNKYGTIEVMRGNSEKRSKLFCPYRKYVDPKTGRQECSFCGTECANFSEPVKEGGQIVVKICHNEFSCDETNFVDERE